MKIYLIAGEASGDVIGSLLMAALESKHGKCQFYGIGGPLMQDKGMTSLFPVHELSIMGLAEVLPRVKHILGRIRETAEHIQKIQPDIVITIDAPDFSFRVAKIIRESANNRPLMIHYVAPTVWAWRPKRAEKVARLYDGIICLFPFEPPYFQRHNLPAAYVGHPVMEQGYVGASGISVREKFGIGKDEIILGLFFGSRVGEVERHGETLRATAQKISQDYPGIHFIVPTLSHIESSVREYLKDIPNVHLTVDNPDKPGVFSSMTAAVAVSGTVALELSVANVPHVIGYRVKPVTFHVLKHLIKVRFAHLTNILLNKEVVPEFIQDDFNADKIASALKTLLKFGHDVENQCAEFATVRKLLNGKTKELPSEQAALFILDQYRQKTDTTFVPYANAS
jgi:lipid-A-disaccharide synthase